ncbi:Transposon Ty3-I Gag-Pol polyprotein [Thelohanellus kitauei]|uniref:RNA-directed DNA polymerase n=1 Tax=Thelohanellus kitauei TaxID=669202 RepID=A0A0C2MNJ3_THEKT|nr:Transposon Ty3-I Gag-Pol polyprotein [Thelohanellus kitauei]
MDRLSKLEGMFSQALMNPRQPTNETPQRWRITCDRCGAAGHKAKDCRGQARCTSCGARGHVGRICPNRNTGNNYNTSSRYISSTFNPNNISGDILFTLTEFCIGGRALIDTGSSTSIINARLAKVTSVFPTSLILKTANGSRLDTTGQGWFTVSFSDIELRWLFVVSDQIPYDMIIGRDILSSHSLTVEVSPKTVTLRKNIVSCVDNLLLDISVKANLAFKTSISQLANKYEALFSKGDCDYGRCNLEPLKIDTGDSLPLKSKPYDIPIHLKAEVDRQIQSMLRTGAISPCKSSWVSPIVLVKKKNNSYRLCVDYRKLNNVTVKDKYPLPNIEEIFDRFSGSKVFSTIDLKCGYWQLELNDDSKSKTAFIPYPGAGLYQFNVLPFGLCNAPPAFQRMMNKVLEGIPGCAVYLDDVIIFSENEAHHLKTLHNVFEAIHRAGLKLNREKCKFGYGEIEFMGYIVSDRGLHANTDSVKPILDWKAPTNTTNLKSFLGMCTFYHRFIRNMATIAAPLYDLLKKGNPWFWSESCNSSFEKLKDRLSNIPTISFPDPHKEFVVNCDASHVAMGAVLSQYNETELVPISFASKSFSSSQKNYSTIDKECCAIVFAVRKFRKYLLGKKFIILTDHNPLVSLRNLKDPRGRRARWLMELEEFDYEIKHLAGNHNVVADTLSRPVAAIYLGVEPDHRYEQHQDKAIGEVIKIISGENVNMSNISEGNLFVSDGCLYHRGRRGIQYVAPFHVRKEIITSIHCDALKHMGANKTEAAIRQRYYWPNLRHDVITFINACTPCSIYKCKNYTPKAKLNPVIAHNRFECWEIDFTGPLIETHRGNRYIIVFTDKFSKWVEALPVPDQSAQTAARALLECVVYRYGVPKRIHSDQGKSFESALISHMCQYLGCVKSRTTPYHPSGNGQVERCNKTIKNILRICVREDSTEWDQHIGGALFAIRSSIHKSTGFSPACLTYGQELKLPIDLKLYDNTEDLINKGYHVFVNDLNRKLHSAFTAATSQLEKNGIYMSAAYNKHLNERFYKQGDRVLLKCLRGGKLDPKFEGPFVIENAKHPVYTIRKSFGDRSCKTVHHDLLFPCLRINNDPAKHDGNQVIRSALTNKTDGLRRSQRIRRPPPHLSEYTLDMIRRGKA